MTAIHPAPSDLPGRDAVRPPDPSSFFQPDKTERSSPPKTSLVTSLLAGRNAMVLAAVAVILIFSGLALAVRPRGNGPAVNQPGTDISSPGNPSVMPSSGFSNHPPDISLPSPSTNPSPPPAGGPAPAPAPTPSPTPAPAPAPAPVPTPTPAPPPAAPHQVKYTSQCFNPSSLTIKKGETVQFVNNSNKYMRPHAEPRSTYPEFDPGTNIAPNASWSFTFTKTGSFFYRDTNKPTCSGTIKVL